MSSEERKQILNMVEEGKITAEEAMNLINALDQSHTAEELEVIVPPTGQSEGKSTNNEFEAVKRRARQFTSIPLAAGTILTVLAAYWMFTLVQNSNFGFWFLCAWAPLLFGKEGRSWYNLVLKHLGPEGSRRTPSVRILGVFCPSGWLKGCPAGR